MKLKKISSRIKIKAPAHAEPSGAIRIVKSLGVVVVLACSLWATSCSSGLPEIPATGIKLPDGFRATMFADSIGPARHIAVTAEGIIYVKLSAPRDSMGVVMLTPDGGQAVVTNSFGNYPGTGVYVKDGYLYATSNSSIFRYKLNDDNEVIDPKNPETIVSGLVDHGQHNSKSIVLDNDGNIYVNIGAFSNACQQEDRTKGSKGMQPCPILDSAGGIWKFKASVAGQTFKDGVRYATGLRNVVGLDWNNETNKLFVMQHGRDQFNNLYPEYYTTAQSADLPAECLYELSEGTNCGWPYIYYDQNQKKKMVSPEYGGDGKMEDTHAEYVDPVAAFPGHMAPNGLLFYTGDQFPEKYKNGAFIAFHGSWNRAPEPQAGYFVVFQPFANGKPSGEYEVFAEGFSGSSDNTAKGTPDRRPCGLAQGPDGSIYITDDKKGGIFKIMYGGKTTASVVGE